MCQYWAFTVDLHASCVCNVCVFADSSPQGCVTCDWGSTLKDKVCYPRCEEGRYFSEEVRYDSCAFLNFSHSPLNGLCYYRSTCDLHVVCSVKKRLYKHIALSIIIRVAIQLQETCEPCHSSCRHCTGPRPDQCLTCHRDSALHATENRCAQCCQAGGNYTDCCVCDSRSGRYRTLTGLFGCNNLLTAFCLL